MAEVLQSLRNLVKDVESTRMPSVCGTSLLKMLAHNARNYLRILTHPNVTVVVKRCFPVSPPTCIAEPHKLHLCTDLHYIKLRVFHKSRILKSSTFMMSGYMGATTSVQVSIIQDIHAFCPTLQTHQLFCLMKNYTTLHILTAISLMHEHSV